MCLGALACISALASVGGRFSLVVRRRSGYRYFYRDRKIVIGELSVDFTMISNI